MPAIMVLIVLSAHTQTNISSKGARSIGMGYTAVANKDLWAVFNNQGAAASQGVLKAGIFMKNHFLLSDMNQISLGLFIPLYKGGLCASVEHFGGDLYSEMKAGLGYSIRFGDYISAGLQLDYMRLNIGEGHGSFQAISFEGGILATISKSITLGVHCFNPIAAHWSKSNERIPVIFKAGLAVKANASFIINAEVAKSSLYKATFMAGFEYRFHEKFFIRTGITSGPARYTFGAGFRSKRLVIDIASSVHSYLGYSPQLSFTYTAGK